MLWSNVKSLNCDTRIWGINKEFESNSQQINIIMFESALKRCGKYLTNLNAAGYGAWDSKMTNIIEEECPNLQNIEIGHQSLKKITVAALLPIFSRLKKLDVRSEHSNEDPNDDNKLKNLLSSNEKLEYFSIILEHPLNGSFLSDIPCTLKELIITCSCESRIQLDTICHVSYCFVCMGTIFFNFRYFILLFSSLILFLYKYLI